MRLSIVIPTLNSAGALPRSLSPLAQYEAWGLVHEVILADGGSDDVTGEIAEAAGARFLRCPRGRGAQLARGAEAARGDWLLFLHDDTALDAGWAWACETHAERLGPAVAGYFRFALDDEGVAPALLEKLVAARCSAFALPYGDQGLLISKQAYRAIGGFRDMPLMEDVAMARALGRKRLAPLAHRAVTSAEKYRRDGYLRRSLGNLWLLARYFLGARPERLAAIYR